MEPLHALQDGGAGAADDGDGMLGYQRGEGALKVAACDDAQGYCRAHRPCEQAGYFFVG